MTETVWPIITGIFVAAGSAVGFFVALLKIKKLNLSIKELENKLDQSSSIIHKITPQEIEDINKSVEEYKKISEHVNKLRSEIENSIIEQKSNQELFKEHSLKQKNELFDILGEVESKIRYLKRKRQWWYFWS